MSDRIEDVAVGEFCTVRCAGEVRWFTPAGKGEQPHLQQRWLKEVLVDGHGIELQEEWRDVPFHGETNPNT